MKKEKLRNWEKSQEEYSYFLTNQYLDSIFIRGNVSDHPISDAVAKKTRLPKLGDHLITSRVFYTHHGLYAGNESVIHYSGLSDGLASGPVEEVSLDDFCSGKGYYVKPHPHASYLPDDIVERARNRLFEENYNLLFNNCEHFVNYCIYGQNSSAQIDSYRQSIVTAGAKTIGKSNPAAAAALIIPDLVQSIKSYTSGDISQEKFYEEVSHTAVTSTSMIYYAALGQTAIPIPVVGSFVGAGVGYFIGNALHKSGLIALGDSENVKVAKRRRSEIKKMCSTLIPIMRQSRVSLENYLDSYFEDRESFLGQALSELELAAEDDCTEGVIGTLETINGAYGHKLEVPSIDELDQLMGFTPSIK